MRRVGSGWPAARFLAMKFTLVSLLLVSLFAARAFAIPLAERVRLTTEHVDLLVILAPEGTNLLQLVVRDEDRRTNHFATNAVLVVAEAAKLSVPDGFPDLGPAGSDLWVLPASQNTQLLYLGVSGENLALPQQPLDLFVRRIEGASHLAIWQFDGLGGIDVGVNSRDGLTAADRLTPNVGGHEHHNFGFTTNGYATVWMQARATVGGTNAWSPETPILFAVEPVPSVPAGPATLVAAGLEPDGSLRLQLLGTPETRYRLERSTDLNSWEAVEDVVAATNGMTVATPPPGNATQWFFRAVTP
jgi:hypothetical protein